MKLEDWLADVKLFGLNFEQAVEYALQVKRQKALNRATLDAVNPMSDAERAFWYGDRSGRE